MGTLAHAVAGARTRPRARAAAPYSSARQARQARQARAAAPARRAPARAADWPRLQLPQAPSLEGLLGRGKIGSGGTIPRSQYRKLGASDVLASPMGVVRARARAAGAGATHRGLLRED